MSPDELMTGCVGSAPPLKSEEGMENALTLVPDNV
jgi:hypothetical protein